MKYRSLIFLFFTTLLFISCNDVNNSNEASNGNNNDGDEASDDLVSYSSCVIDQPNSTWTDTNTGYMWLWHKFPISGTISEVIAECDTLDFEGYTDWRAPTIVDLRTLIRGCGETTNTGGSCLVSNTCFSEEHCYTEEDCGNSEYSSNDPESYKVVDDLKNCYGESVEISSISNSPEGGVWTVNFRNGSVYSVGCGVLSPTEFDPDLCEGDKDEIEVASTCLRTLQPGEIDGDEDGETTE